MVATLRRRQALGIFWNSRASPNIPRAGRFRLIGGWVSWTAVGSGTRVVCKPIAAFIEAELCWDLVVPPWMQVRRRGLHRAADALRPMQ
eukprot:9467995-Pyramimonas_sp.AAC.1